MNIEIPASLAKVFERQAHPYHMWDGIQSIPTGMEDILAPQSLDAIRAAARALQGRLPVHLMGCGTSYFAAEVIALAFQQLADLPAYAWEAFEFLAYPPPRLETSAVVGISHTGGTPPLVRAVELARARGAATLAYTDGPQSALARASQWVVPSTMGSEPALPKTRSYIATLMRGYLQAVELARLAGRDVAAWESALQKAPQAARKVIASSAPQVKELAATWQDCRRIVVVGGGPQHATAQEGMLKLIEASMSDATTWEMEEAVHGTWSSTTENDLILILAMQGPSYESAVRLAGGMKTIGAQVWLISDCPWKGITVDAITALPGGEPELLTPLYAILPIYLFSYELALVRKLSPDNMRLTDPRFLEARMQMRTSLA